MSYPAKVHGCGSLRSIAIILSMAVALAACGGGSDDGSSLTTPTPPTGPVTVPPGTPSIGGNPPTTIQSGQAYSFTPSSSDPGGKTLTFSITNKPLWANFSTANGALSGTPAAANVGTTSGIVIKADNGTNSASLPAFSLTVTAAPGANRPPVISGTPATAISAGGSYLFAPVASDPDGNPLTFSITNKPSWITTFNTTNGTMSGVPQVADAGVYSNIVITVNDGKGGTASLGAFAITVTQTGSGTVTVTWTIPALNTDGSILLPTDLTGYKIYYGSSSTAINQSVDVTGGLTLTKQVGGLSSGTYYFQMTAKTATDESDRTNLASTTVP